MTQHFKQRGDLLPSEIRQLSSHRSDLSDRSQDVLFFFGVLTHVCNLLGLSEQALDVLFSLWASMRICQPVLPGEKKERTKCEIFARRGLNLCLHREMELMAHLCSVNPFGYDLSGVGHGLQFASSIFHLAGEHIQPL